MVLDMGRKRETVKIRLQTVKICEPFRNIDSYAQELSGPETAKEAAMGKLYKQPEEVIMATALEMESISCSAP